MKDLQQDILTFWFEETQPKQWFQGGEAFDQIIVDRFSEGYALAADGGYEEWKNSADGALAFCVLLDQMPRNMFRGTSKAFQTDIKALTVAKYAISKGLDQELPVTKRRFVYLPFEHSEDIDDQRRSVDLFEKIKDEDLMGYDYAVRHFDVIDQYGRFPHRNKILGRTNTSAEEEYLSDPNAGF